MIERDDLRHLEGKYVCVKTPHMDGWPKTFQRYGTLKLRDNCVILENKGLLVTIKYDFILEVAEVRR